MNFKEAVKVVQDGIRNDPELYYGYQANIAMAFVDAIANWRRKSKLNAGYINKTVIYETANEAAKNFLNLWMRRFDLSHEIHEK